MPVSIHRWRCALCETEFASHDLAQGCENRSRPALPPALTDGGLIRDVRGWLYVSRADVHRHQVCLRGLNLQGHHPLDPTASVLDRNGVLYLGLESQEAHAVTADLPGLAVVLESLRRLDQPIRWIWTGTIWEDAPTWLTTHAEIIASQTQRTVLDRAIADLARCKVAGLDVSTPELPPELQTFVRRAIHCGYATGLDVLGDPVRSTTILVARWAQILLDPGLLSRRPPGDSE